MRWYYANNGQRLGPVTEEEFRRLIKVGIIRDDTLVWYPGMKDWRPYASFVANIPPIPTVEEATAAAAAEPFVPTSGALDVEYAGFWLRVGASLIDGVILWVAGQVVGGLVIGGVYRKDLAFLTGATPDTLTAEQMVIFFEVMALSLGISVLVSLAYELFFLRRWSATPGKLALGLRVRRPDGSALGTGRIIGRFFAKMLSSLCFGIGYLMVAFDGQKRGLHDHISDTRVVKVR